MSPSSHPQAEELARYIAGQLEAEQRKAVSAHLEGCARCRGELETLSAMKLGATAVDTKETDSIGFANTIQRPVPGGRLIPTRSEESFPALANVTVGQEIGRYVVTGQLGRGAMGVVLAAQDPRLQRKVAIKLLRPDVPVVESAQLRQRLMREAQALALLSHPNVVPVHDVGDFGDSVFIAMDYVEGQTLTEWMRFGEHAWQEVVRVMRQAGQGLAAAHKAGLVHRDFKPDNVLVGSDGHVRVSDFGVSRKVRPRDVEGEETITGVGSLIGTPNYMSPEQFDARPADARSDQFSFCVVLYEALYGDLPFDGSTLRERRDAVHEGPKVAQPRGSRVPKWLHALVLKGLSPQPDQRFESMEALLAILARPPLDRRLVAAVAVSVLAVLSLTGWLAMREVQRRRDDLCLTAPDRLAKVWSAETRAATRQAMESTGKPYAGTTWALAERAVAHFAEVWKREYAASCAQERSSDIRATASARVTQLCLESRLDSLKMVVDEARDGALKLDTWLPTLEDLSLFESCGETETWIEPEDPLQRQRFRELRSQLEKARMLSNLGKETASLPLAVQATEAARELGFRRLEAGGLFIQGTVKRRLGYAGEAAELYEASALAAEAGRADALLFDARLEGALALTSELSLEKGKAALPAVRTALERVGATPRRRLALGRLEIALATQEGRVNDAVTLQRKLLADSIALTGEESFQVADEYRMLALTLNRANQPQEALSVAKHHLELVRKLYGDNHPFVGQSWSTMATVLSRDQRNEEALTATLEALKRLEPGDDRREYQTSLYNSGLAYQRLKRLPEAQKAMEAALAIQGSAPDSVHAQMLSGLAELLQNSGQLEKALEYSERSVKMKEKIYGPGSIHLTVELSAYGSILEGLGRHEEAARVLKQTLDILEASKAKPMLTEITRYELARVLWNSPATRNEAVKMVKDVSAWFHAKGPNYKDYYDEADDWLVKHPPVKE